MMLPAEMRPWSRTVFFVFFLPLGLALLSSCVRMLYELLKVKDLLAVIEPLMYYLGCFQFVSGIFIFSTICFLVYAVLTRNSQLLKHGLFYQETSTLICFAIMILLLVIRYPSLKTDENLLNNAMSSYGKDDSMTKMIDTTQSEFKCCGITRLTDWKRVNATFIVPALSYEVSSEAVARVPFTCATINETSVRFYTGGCLVPFYAYKDHTARILLLNTEILIFFQMSFLFLVGGLVDMDILESNKVFLFILQVFLVLLMFSIYADYGELNAAANAERKQGEDVPSIFILEVPPMAFEA